ncbi:MAG TPA: DUF6282 family protein [Acidimicrobiales bacterium]|nr:DUF6282 family protein [Acidimicrobiales bacterium]
MSTALDIVADAVDLYVHAEPDLLPRRSDDLGLAAELSVAGYAAAVHRHHFSDTVDRARLASDATGFDLRGAVLLNDAVGGLNPAAAELALRLGGRWIGLPTLSAAFFRSGLSAMPAALRDTLGFGPGRLRLVDDAGRVLPEVQDILELAVGAGAVVNVGYCSAAEAHAVLAAVPRHDRLVLTTPLGAMRLQPPELDELMTHPGVHVEVTAYSLHPDGPSQGRNPDAVAGAAALIRRVGVDRCVLSSDGGMAGAPGPPELLAWAAGHLAEAGLNDAEIVRLVRETPAALLGL